MININLISERERQRRIGEFAGRVAFFVAVGLFILMTLTITVQQTRVRTLRSAIEATNAEIDRLQAQKSQLDLLKGQIDSKRPLVELLRTARDSEAKWCNALTHITDALPPGVVLTAVHSSSSLQPKIKDESSTSKQPVKYEGFTISGEATTNDQVGQFMKKLQETASFGDVYLQSTRRRQSHDQAVVVQFDVQALLAKENPTP